MSSSKAKSKSKWFHCFKVVVESTGVKKENISCDKLPMDLSDDDNMVFPLHDIDHGRRRRKRIEFRCGFSRIVKDVFFQTSAAKKTRSKKFGEQVSSVGGNSSPSPSSEGSSGHSSRTSLFSSSPSGLSLSQNSSCSSLSNLSSPSERKPSDLADINMIMMKPLNNNKKNILVKKNGDDNANIGLYFLLVICLMGLVFSGKAFAIFCTAACLFLFQGAAGNSSR